MAYYFIKQVSDITQLKPHVLRYYEKEGLMPPIQRSEGGIRCYTDQDLEWLGLICCLKNTGMSIKQIKEFMALSQQGDETLEKRCDMLVQHRKGVEQHLREMEKHLYMVKQKLQYFWDLYEQYQDKQQRMAEQLKRMFTQQVGRYPNMMPQDAVKLIYQNEFGGGHIIANAQSSLNYLRKEYETITYDEAIAACEDIGNGMCRLNLKAIAPGGVSLETVNNMFVKSADRVTGSRASLRAKLDVLRTLAKEGSFSFTMRELEDYLAIYQKEGYPMVRHSNAYRDAYNPAYRVVLKQYAACMGICARIDALLRDGDHIAVAIDGNCGSGKTTLAGLLGDLYDANVVHMDDFFLPVELRTPQRLDTPGGNVHYERFLQEAADGIRNGAGFTHRVFDCQTMDYGEEKRFEPRRVTIVEGSYSLHPKLFDLYDLRIFTTCGEDEQKRRIKARNADGEAYQNFLQRWIPMENRYFDAYNICENCDYILNTGADT